METIWLGRKEKLKPANGAEVGRAQTQSGKKISTKKKASDVKSKKTFGNLIDSQWFFRHARTETRAQKTKKRGIKQSGKAEKAAQVHPNWKKLKRGSTKAVPIKTPSVILVHNKRFSGTRKWRPKRRKKNQNRRLPSNMEIKGMCGRATGRKKLAGLIGTRFSTASSGNQTCKGMDKLAGLGGSEKIRHADHTRLE